MSDRRWFRLYDEFLDDPKIQTLPADVLKGLLNIWCLASKNDGKLPDIRTLMFRLRMNENEVAYLLNELAAKDFIENNAKGDLVPHAWDRRQYRSDISTERVKRFRRRYMKRDETVQDSDSDTEKKDSTKGLQSQFGGPSSAVATLIKRATKKIERSNYVWLKPTDTRVARARVWWRENYGSELPVQYQGTKQGYRVPWDAVQ